jgi:hypothetical protein
MVQSPKSGETLNVERLTSNVEVADPEYTRREMEGASPEMQAITAITYMLQHFKEDRTAHNLFGFRTRPYGLLTEALASLTGEDLKTVRERYLPAKIPRIVRY